MSAYAIRCEGVGKKFSKSLKKSMLYGALDIFQSAIGFMPKPGPLRPDEFWSVDDITFDIKEGESFGIIGPNGSGKTTLLKMLNGIFMPDKGKITTHGKMGALIQVGAGFHPMLSGRENIYVNGAILGMSKAEIIKKFDAIVDFADIGDFLDSPVKFYSSGMYVRLGFAIAVHCRPDILLIDEILAVGDLKFQSKCLKFITNNILKSGCSVIFVSHNRYAIEDVCKEVLYLNKGKVVKIGKTLDVIDKYLEDIKNSEITEHKTKHLLPNDLITRVEFYDNDLNIKTQFKAGDEMRIRFFYTVSQPLVSPSIAITLNHDDPRFALVSSTDYIFNLHSGYDGLEVPMIQGDGFFEVMIKPLYLPVGIYNAAVYVYADNTMNLVRKYDKVGQIEMLWSDDKPKRSLIELPHQWSIHE